MNNENNNFNNEQNINNTPVVPSTTPVADKFMTVSDINQINQQVNTVSVVEPSTTPVVSQPVPVVEPSTTPVVPQPVPVVEPTTQPEVTTVPVGMPQQDNNAMVNENLQKVEIKNYTPPSKFKIFVLLLFFCLIVAFIIFLPQISTFVRTIGSGETSSPKEEKVITTGKLVCTLTSNTSELDKDYEFNFDFTDSKLKRTKYIVYTRGDTTTEALLDEANEKCKTLKEETKDLEGVTIKCEYTDGKLNETQIFDLETVDTEKLSAAFTEAGGILPSYNYDQNIDDIESTMKASGYTCERQN